MNSSTCTGWYLTLIICSHLQINASLPSTADAKHSKEVSKDSSGHNDSSELDKDKESVKRGWKYNTMQVWGKRSDGVNELSKLTSTSDGEIERYDKLVNTEQSKRKWGKNNMPV